MQPDGGSLKAHLESVWRQTGRMPPQLDVPDRPYLAGYLWDWFCQLSRERASDAAGNPCYLNSEKLLAWGTLWRVKFTAFELEAISQLDRLFMTKGYDKEEPDD